eukprot:scaffold130465_cov22-Tisochrysis_lutea.AAC.2
MRCHLPPDDPKWAAPNCRAAPPRPEIRTSEQQSSPLWAKTCPWRWPWSSVHLHYGTAELRAVQGMPARREAAVGVVVGEVRSEAGAGNQAEALLASPQGL